MTPRKNIETPQRVIDTKGAPPTAQAGQVDTEQLSVIRQVVAQEIVALLDTGCNTDAEWVVWMVLEFHPEVGRMCSVQALHSIATKVLHSEIPEQSEHFENLFEEFNERYFGNQLPHYRVRVVYDVHRVAAEPITRRGDSGEELIDECLLRFDERTIYLRFSEDGYMLNFLVHEMCHAATSGEHDEKWKAEMKRVYELGAPLEKWNFSPDSPAK
jgi:hypothetical protein